ncbi:unnamed protein product, partial [Phaeothamnion confervicola]
MRTVFSDGRVSTRTVRLSLSQFADFVRVQFSYPFEVLFKAYVGYGRVKCMDGCGLASCLVQVRCISSAPPLNFSFSPPRQGLLTYCTVRIEGGGTSFPCTVAGFVPPEQRILPLLTGDIFFAPDEYGCERIPENDTAAAGGDDCVGDGGGDNCGDGGGGNRQPAASGGDGDAGRGVVDGSGGGGSGWVTGGSRHGHGLLKRVSGAFRWFSGGLAKDLSGLMQKVRRPLPLPEHELTGSALSEPPEAGKEPPPPPSSPLPPS